MEKFLASIKKLRHHGDASEIAKIVNQKRTQQHEEALTPTYVRMMLSGTRTLTTEVHAVAKVYYEAEAKKQKELKQAFA